MLMVIVVPFVFGRLHQGVHQEFSPEGTPADAHRWVTAPVTPSRQHALFYINPEGAGVFLYPLLAEEGALHALGRGLS